MSIFIACFVKKFLIVNFYFKNLSCPASMMISYSNSPNSISTSYSKSSSSKSKSVIFPLATDKAIFLASPADMILGL